MEIVSGAIKVRERSKDTYFQGQVAYRCWGNRVSRHYAEQKTVMQFFSDWKFHCCISYVKRYTDQNWHYNINSKKLANEVSVSVKQC